VLLSVNATFLKIKIKEGKKYAENLQQLKKKIDEPLIIILSLNTIAHTLGSILVGVEAKNLYSSISENSDLYIFGILIGEDLLVGIVSAIMTILILLVSEIIPKTLGANYWSSLAKFTSIFLSSLIPLFKYSGVLWLLQSFTRILGKSSQETGMKREDFSTMAEIAEEEGIIEEKESDFIKNLIKFKDVKVKTIMTPHSVMETADESTTINNFYKKSNLVFSRIPLFSKNSNNINGYVLKDKILENIINKKGNSVLAKIKRPLIITDSESKIPFIFDKFLKEREHISLVKDKDGSIEGLVTLEDILETILGLEIVDETDQVEDLQLLAKKKEG
jgi:CBS domain containing-hemolysin-like protein